MVGNITVCIGPAITTGLRTKSYGISPFNPRFYRKNKIIAPGCIFNCTEFGTIKIRVIQYFSFPKIFNRTFKAKPTKDNMLLHLTPRHVGKADIIFILKFDYRDVSVLNCYFCHY